MPLTDTQIRNAKPKSRPYKLSDSGGLLLLVHPNGSKYWRQKYRFAHKEKTLSHGVYPEVTLKEAREKRDDARKLLSNGVDPQEAKQVQKTKSADVDSFGIIAREWFAKYSPNWARSHSGKVRERLDRDIVPWLDKRPIQEITAPELLKVLRRIEDRGALETAHRARGDCSRIFRYAIATGRAERDPASDLRGALSPVGDVKHFAALVEPKKVGELLRSFDGFTGTFVVQCALRLSPLLFVRPGELRTARWVDIDLDKGEWKFLVSKTKVDHIVPLASQAIAILRELNALTGTRDYVFPGLASPKKPMSEAAINAALRRLGYDTKTEITGHGFRAMARTILHEELHIKPEVIEHQLAHRVPDALGTAYNRTKFLSERRAMMQQWADFLDKLKSSI